MNNNADLWMRINQAKPENYLIADPFSHVGNSDLSGSINNELFFNKLNILSHYSYLRLAIVLDVVNDPNKNTLFITGFRGTGKTTFVNMLKQIVENKYTLPNLGDVFNDELQETDDTVNEKIIEDYEKVLSQIKNILGYYESDEALTTNNINNLLMQKLRGLCLYINFEKETKDYKQPIEQVINFRIKDEFKTVFDSQRKVYQKFKSIIKSVPSIECFESTSELHYKKFIDFILDDDFNDWDSFLNGLDKHLASLNINQLLSIITLISITRYSIGIAEKKQFFIFDNIDIIQDNERRVLEDFLTEYSVFIVNMEQIMRDLQKASIDIDFYTDMTFIFVMRETTTMLINEHFQDRLKNFSEHFDISSDIDKGKIIKKRKCFLEDNTSHITNKRLQEGVDYIYNASLDYYVRDYIYSLFNNDYKRIIGCISQICQTNKKSLIDEQLEMISHPINYDIIKSIKYGSRSILLRLILDNFYDNKYFKTIGVDKSISRSLKYSPSRIILTYLFGFQSDHNDRFMIHDDNSILVYELYDDLKPLFGGSDEIAFELFVNTLWGMFSLRTSSTWNHLITFDSIKSISKDAIKNAIISKEDMHVRITCAGRYYIRYICTHFEFFSCRCNRDSYPLFSKYNNKYIANDKQYRFEQIIQKVFKKVANCCHNLLVSEENTFIRSGEYTRYSLLDSPCFYSMNNAKASTHAERIIHNHIQYLDAYRLYLINGSFSNNVQPINRILIHWIKKYLDLMKPCDNCTLDSCINCKLSSYNQKQENGIVSGHFSSNNKDLYSELTECVNQIEQNNFLDTSTNISREYYLEKIKKKNK